MDETHKYYMKKNEMCTKHYCRLWDNRKELNMNRIVPEFLVYSPALSDGCVPEQWYKVEVGFV